MLTEVFYLKQDAFRHLADFFSEQMICARIVFQVILDARFLTAPNDHGAPLRHQVNIVDLVPLFHDHRVRWVLEVETLTRENFFAPSGYPLQNHGLLKKLKNFLDALCLIYSDEHKEVLFA